MADQRIIWTERLIGAGHPAYSDTLNRLALSGHNPDGSHKNFIDLRDYGFSTGADPGDNKDAFNDAVGDMVSGDVLIIPKGTYPVAPGAIFDPDHGCGLNCHGVLQGVGDSGVLLQIGTTSSFRSLYTVDGLRIARNAPDHSKELYGLRLVNLYAGKVDIRQVSDFYVGIMCYGTGTGHVFNIISLGSIWNNKYSLFLYAANSGWCNENIFIGGAFSWASAQDTDLFRHIWLDHYADNRLNNNKFYGQSLESEASTGSGGAYGVYCEGWNNQFLGLRYEMDSSDKKVYLTSNSQENLIMLGIGLTHASIIDEGDENKYITTTSHRLNYTTISRGASPPASGTWRQGDIFWNYNASTGGVAPGWVCIAGGSSSVWKAMPALSS